MLFFFFKQKTAYDMRISDWSSDVCSSDLQVTPSSLRPPWISPWLMYRASPPIVRAKKRATASAVAGLRSQRRSAHASAGRAARSEEHTSELQSLMRISYAVCCLQKKK